MWVNILNRAENSVEPNRNHLELLRKELSIPSRVGDPTNPNQEPLFPAPQVPAREIESKTMANTQNKRRRAVADAQVQYSLARRVVLHFFVFICAGTIFGIINQFFADPFAGVQENLATFARHSAPMLVALICLMPIFVRDTLTLSNKIAGPIHNLRNTIKAHAEGDSNVRPLKFRQGDFWDDLPDDFNAMTERLQHDTSQTAGTEQELVEASV